MLYKLLIFLTPKAYAQQSIMGEFRRLVCPGVTTNQKVTDCMTQLDLRDAIVLVNVIIRIAFGLAGIIALIYFIYSGYLFMTSAGNPDALAKAKTKLLYTALGFILIIVAFLLVNFIINTFGASGTSIDNPLSG